MVEMEMINVVNKKKIIQLEDDEEIFIISNNKVLNIKNNNGIFIINETTSTDLEVNTKIININFEELKRFVLFESYYQSPNTTELNEDLEKLINKIMDYHMDTIYGKGNSDREIVDTEFQCISYYE